MGMDVSYIEISQNTLTEILNDASVLDSIIYGESDKALTIFDIGNKSLADEVEDIFYTLLDRAEKTKKLVTDVGKRTLWYDDFPGYFITYDTVDEVSNIWQRLSEIDAKIQNDTIEPKWFVEEGWYDAFIDYYKNAAERGSAQLYCIT